MRSSDIPRPLGANSRCGRYMLTSSAVTISGPIGMLPSKFYPAVHCDAARCQSRADASFSTVNPAIASIGQPNGPDEVSYTRSGPSSRGLNAAVT